MAGGWRLVSVVTLVLGMGVAGCEKAKSRVNINLSQAPKVVVEAENPDADTLTAPMFIETMPGTSGGNCLTVTEGAGKPNGDRPDGSKYPEVWGKAEYTVEVPAQGKYAFWARVHWDDPCGNSVALVMDDRASYDFNDSVFKTWHWVKGPTWELSAGKHRLVILNREDGVRLDQFLLTTDAGYRPVGIE